MKIEFEKHFVPSNEAVDTILGDYGMDLMDYKFPENGMANTTLLVTTPLGDYALRVYRQDRKDDSAIENEVHLMHHMRTDFIPTPTVVPTMSGQLMTHLFVGEARWQAILMEALPGDTLDNYDSNTIDRIAAVQARMHERSKYFLPPYQEPCVGVLDEQPFIDLIDQESLSDPKLVAFLDRAREYTVDLAYALWAVHFYADEKRMTQYSSTYKQNRPLSPVEEAYVSQVMLYKNYVTTSMAVLYGYQDDPRMERFFSIEESLLSA